MRRPAPRGTEIAASGSARVPEAISMEPLPMSRGSIRPADQPYQPRAARKVSRASSRPLMKLAWIPVAASISARTASWLVASRMAEVA